MTLGIDKPGLFVERLERIGLIIKTARDISLSREPYDVAAARAALTNAIAELQRVVDDMQYR